jgi:hypothetical protein
LLGDASVAPIEATLTDSSALVFKGDSREDDPYWTEESYRGLVYDPTPPTFTDHAVRRLRVGELGTTAALRPTEGGAEPRLTEGLEDARMSES